MFLVKLTILAILAHDVNFLSASVIHLPDTSHLIAPGPHSIQAVNEDQSNLTHLITAAELHTLEFPNTTASDLNA